jgi:hypothetical protein
MASDDWRLRGQDKYLQGATLVRKRYSAHSAQWGTANGNGGYQNCYSSWWWLNGFPGWHTQVWCGWGYSGI